MRKLFLALIAILAVTLFAGCDSRSPYRHCEGVIWATSYHITYRSEKMLDDSVLAVLRGVEQSLSPFIDSSLVSDINAGVTDRTDSLFRRIFLTSCEISRISGGAYDPTVAPLVNLWGFGYRTTGREPTQQQIDSALNLVGILECRLEGNRIVKRSPETEFDFSSITKGYACDLVGDMLRRNGCSDFIVEIGGEVRASGENDRGHGWRIMIDAPVENDTAVVHSGIAVIEISDCGVATSGNYRNYRKTSAGKSWHTISPATGRPAVSSTLSATVIAPDAMTADALATACMVLQPDSALSMMSRLPHTEALLVSSGPKGFELHPTSGFPEMRR